MNNSLFFDWFSVLPVYHLNNSYHALFPGNWHTQNVLSMVPGFLVYLGIETIIFVGVLDIYDLINDFLNSDINLKNNFLKILTKRPNLILINDIMILLVFNVDLTILSCYERLFL